MGALQSPHPEKIQVHLKPQYFSFGGKGDLTMVLKFIQENEREEEVTCLWQDISRDTGRSWHLHTCTEEMLRGEWTHVQAVLPSCTEAHVSSRFCCPQAHQAPHWSPIWTCPHPGSSWAPKWPCLLPECHPSTTGPNSHSLRVILATDQTEKSICIFKKVSGSPTSVTME